MTFQLKSLIVIGQQTDQTKFFFEVNYKNKAYRGSINVVGNNGANVSNVIANKSNRTLSWTSGVKEEIVNGLMDHMKKFSFGEMQKHYSPKVVDYAPLETV